MAVPVMDGLDLRQLRFLLALLRCASITQAGQASGLSQPAASRTMARLRQQVGDALLVRKRSGYVLTAKAQALEHPLQQALALLDAALAPQAFEPARTRRVFQLASTDYGVSSVAQRCLPLLGTSAPLISLRFDPWGADTLARLEQGQLDFALYADAALPGEFHYRNLFREHYVLMGSCTHPLWRELAPGPLDATALRAASAYPHAAVRYPSGTAHETDDVYRRLGLPSPHLRLELPYFSTSTSTLMESGLLMLMPARAQPTEAPATITVRRVDIAALSFDYRLIWHARNHRDEGCVWLRQCIAQACG